MKPQRPAPPGPRPPSRPREETEKVYGLNAALAVFAVRPEDIVRVAHTRAVRREVADLLRAAAARRIPYQEVEDDELARIADAVHHEGVCLTTRPRRPASVAKLTERLLSGRDGGAIALDRLGNPHNLGAIVRSAAYFGTEGVLHASEQGQARLTSSAVRIAEGGAEYVPVVEVPSLPQALAELRARGVRVLGTDARATHSAFAERWPRPCIVVIGNERSGLSPAVRAQCDGMVAVPGSGDVDSLNASVAAGVILAELARTRGRRGG